MIGPGLKGVSPAGIVMSFSEMLPGFAGAVVLVFFISLLSLNASVSAMTTQTCP